VQQDDGPKVNGVLTVTLSASLHNHTAIYSDRKKKAKVGAKSGQGDKGDRKRK
jgi:hypothetical protein